MKEYPHLCLTLRGLAVPLSRTPVRTPSNQRVLLFQYLEGIRRGFRQIAKIHQAQTALALPEITGEYEPEEGAVGR